MPTFNSTFELFMQSANEFLEAIPKCTCYAELDNGYKTLVLMHIGIPDDTITIDQARIVDDTIAKAGNAMLNRHYELAYNHG